MGAAHRPPPIHWEKYSDDIFARARQQNKLVLLDLEAVWCHWCHVQDEVTYADPKVKALINSHYIAVKVDQDSRPDLSNRYEDYGWPATIVFNSDGGEIAKEAGWIPPEVMARLLQASVDNPAAGSGTRETKIVFGEGSALSAALRKELQDGLDGNYDAARGGWGTIHKLVDWDAIEYSLLRARAGDSQAGQRARQTLDAATKLIDPVWGGVYQYSTDGDWDHPHFEKLMQFQAEILRTYAAADAQFGDARYRKAADAIRGYIANFLTSPDGAFYVSQDADVVQGKHSGEYFAARRWRSEEDWHSPRRHACLCARERVGDPGCWRTTRTRRTRQISPRPGGRRSGSSPIARCPAAGSAMTRRTWPGPTSAILWRWVARSSPSMTPPPTAPGLGGRCSRRIFFGSIYAPRLMRSNGGGVCYRRRQGFLIRSNPGRSLMRTSPPPASSTSFIITPEAKPTDRRLKRRCGILPLRRWPDRTLFVAGLLTTDIEMSTEPLHVTIVGSKSDPAARALFMEAIKSPAAYRRVEWFDPAEGKLPNADVEYPTSGPAAAFVCVGTTCSSPMTDRVRLAGKLGNRRLLTRETRRFTPLRRRDRGQLSPRSRRLCVE